MRAFKTYGMAAVAASMILAGAAPALAQSEDDVQIRTERLSDTVSVLFGRGGNIGVSAGPDGVFIIDDQFADMTDKIRAAVAALSDQPIRYVINTHWHYDHTGGNENFGIGGTPIIAHDNVRKRMVTGGYIKAADRDFPPAPGAALPVITFNDAMSLYLNGEEARLLHAPSAHTDGDGMVWFKGSNVVHMGDTFFNGSWPFIDLGSGGSMAGIIAAADMVLSFIDDKTRIIPGHGPVTDKAGLEAYRAMCIAMRDKIAGMKESGMSLDAVMKAAPTADYDAEWDAWGAEWQALFIDALYEEAP